LGRIVLIVLIAFTAANSFASEIPRFSFEYNWHAHQRSFANRIENQLYEADKNELKEIRTDMIWGEDTGLGFQRKYAYVTAIFDITELLPDGYEGTRFDKLDSLIHKELNKLLKEKKLRQSDHAKIKIMGDSVFFPIDSSKRAFEIIDFYLYRDVYEDLVDLPQFIDIDFAGVSVATGLGDSKVRLLPTSQENDWTMKSGYYQEVLESIARDGVAKVHVSLRDDVQINIDTLLATLKGDDYELIKRGEHELLIQVNTTALQILIRQPQVKVIKDYEFHRALESKRGRWLSAPMSNTRVASVDEVLLLSSKLRTNFLSQGHEVIETNEQYKEFREINASSPFSNQVLLLKELSKFDVDFAKYNLVVLSHQEGSGSIGYDVRPAIWVEGELVIVIDRNIGGRGFVNTMDMVQYSLIFVVNKNIGEISIRDTRGVTRLKNRYDGFVSTYSRLKKEQSHRH